MTNVHGFPDKLPKPPFRSHGPWVCVLVEPMPKPSEVLEVVQSEYDTNTTAGIGWVLSTDKTYTYIPPHRRGEKKAWDYDDKTVVYPTDVVRGDKILFRRYLRSQGLMQFTVLDAFLKQVKKDYPGYECFFIHHEDITGVIDD